MDGGHPARRPLSNVDDSVCTSGSIAERELSV